MPLMSPGNTYPTAMLQLGAIAHFSQGSIISVAAELPLEKQSSTIHPIIALAHRPGKFEDHHRSAYAGES